MAQDHLSQRHYCLGSSCGLSPPGKTSSCDVSVIPFCKKLLTSQLVSLRWTYFSLCSLIFQLIPSSYSAANGRMECLVGVFQRKYPSFRCPPSSCLERPFEATLRRFGLCIPSYQHIQAPLEGLELVDDLIELLHRDEGCAASKRVPSPSPPGLRGYEDSGERVGYVSPHAGYGERG